MVVFYNGLHQNLIPRKKKFLDPLWKLFDIFLAFLFILNGCTDVAPNAIYNSIYIYCSVIVLAMFILLLIFKLLFSNKTYYYSTIGHGKCKNNTMVILQPIYK